MAKATRGPVFDPAASLVEAYRTNDRINHYLVRSLPAAVWRMDPPGGKGRTVAGIVAHIHNVRLMWLKAAGVSPLPDKLDGKTTTVAGALAALESSARAVADLVTSSLAQGGRIKGFKPDAAGFVGYHIAHDAHHRGQITLLCRLLGQPVPPKVMYGMWEWGTR